MSKSGNRRVAFFRHDDVSKRNNRVMAGGTNGIWCGMMRSQVGSHLSRYSGRGRTPGFGRGPCFLYDITSIQLSNVLRWTFYRTACNLSWNTGARLPFAGSLPGEFATSPRYSGERSRLRPEGGPN